MRPSLLTKKIPLILLAAIFAFHIFALSQHLYWRYTWLDIPMHLIGGFAVGLFILAFAKLPRGSERIFIFFAGIMFAGILWELQELLYDTYVLGKPFGGWQRLTDLDTLKDLVNDAIGGLAAYRVKAAYRV